MSGEYNEGIEALNNKIAQKEANIVIIGLGQVGLPTAIAFLERGYRVTGLEINASLVDQLKAGTSPIPEKDIDQHLRKQLQSGTFSILTDADAILDADVIIICVATPLNDSRTGADLSALRAAIISVGKRLNSIKLIIIESTIPPRTMKDFVIPQIETVSGKNAGVDFLVAFCPERISPGKALVEFMNNDRLIGSEDPGSSGTALTLFSKVTKGALYQTDCTTSEISKLAENSYRDVNIAFANELAMICEKHHADVSEVIRLANTHPRVDVHIPGPGVGGPCLPKDPYLLVSNFETKNSVIKTARSINDEMPDHVVNLILGRVDKLGHRNQPISVLILGSSYKPDVNDTRNSPCQKIISKLRKVGITDITVHDPYASETFGAKSTQNLSKSLLQSECVILVTGHSDYFHLGPHMFNKESIILDTVRRLKKSDFIKSGLDYITIG